MTEAMIKLFGLHENHFGGSLDKFQLQNLYSDIRIGGLNIPQVEASMEYVVGSSDWIYQGDLRLVLEEMDRRYFLLKDLHWEFALLDNQHIGVITVPQARFLFEAVHKRLFSLQRWEAFLQSRPVSNAPVGFAEIEVDLCNKPNVEFWPDPKMPVDVIPHIKPDITVKAPKKEKKDTKMIESPKIVSEPPKPNVEKSEISAVEAEEKRKELERKAKEKEEKEIVKQAKIEEEREKRERRAAKKRARKSKEQHVVGNLEDAVEMMERKLLEPAIKEYKKTKLSSKMADPDLLKRAETLLEMLKCSEGLKDAMTRRLIADLESAINNANSKSWEHPDWLSKQVTKANDMLVRLRRLEKLRSEVLDLKQSTIAELRSYKKPLPIIHQVMSATYLLLGTSEKETKKWVTVQSLLGKTGREGLKRRISKCDVTELTVDTVNRTRDLMGEDVDLEAIRDVSAGAATFFVWVEGMIEEVLSSEEPIDE